MPSFIPQTPYLPRIDHFRPLNILNGAHSFSRPTFFLFFMTQYYCNGLGPDTALILLFLLFKSYSSLSWAIFHYPWPSHVDSINAVDFYFFWLVKNGEKEAVFNNLAHTVIQLILIRLQWEWNCVLHKLYFFPSNNAYEQMPLQFQFDFMQNFQCEHWK